MICIRQRIKYITTSLDKKTCQKDNALVKQSITKNYIYNVIYQVIALLTPLITTPYISRVLEADGIGIYSYTTNVNAYFTFFAALGTAKYGLREIAYVSDDKEKLSQLFWSIESLSCICALISLIVYTFFCFFQREKVIYAILSINILAVCFEISWFYQGVGDFRKTAIRNCIIKLLYVVYVFVFVKKKSDVVIYILGLSLLTIISNASLWVPLPQYVEKPKFREIHPLKHLKGTIALFIPTMAIQVYSALDIIMLKTLTSSYAENGYFEQALKLSKMALTLVTSLSAVMLPKVANLYKQKNYSEMKIYMYKSYRFLWMIGIPLCVGLVGISDNFVPWFFGDGYDKVALLLKILSFLIIAMGLSTITGSQYLVSVNKQKEYSFSIIAGMGINIILNYCLIPKYASSGAALASVIAEFIIATIQLIIIKNDFEIKKIFCNSLNYIIAGFILFIILNIENSILSTSIFSSAIMIISGALIYFVSLIIMKDEFFCYYENKVLGRFFPKKKCLKNKYIA